MEGESYQVECDEEHEVHGDEELICGTHILPHYDGYDGEIFDDLPVCKEIPGPCEVPDINYGWMTVDEDNGVVANGEEVFIVCDQPHYAPAQTGVTCIGNNRWDPPIPTCTKEGEFERETSGFCEIPRIRNGWITFGGDNRVIANGEEAFIVCDPPHYAPAQTRVTCIGNNRWDPPIPTCTWEGPTCERPMVPNGVVSPQMNVTVPWAELTVVCNEGYSMEGPSQLVCQTNGQFNNPIPRCVFKGDPNPPPSEMKCGERSSRSLFQPRIYGGMDTMPGEYPWTVLIQLPRGRFCGGSIVNKDWVLTGGKCLLDNVYRTCNNREEPGCKLTRHQDKILITAGVHNRSEEEDVWQVRTVTEIRLHPYSTNQRNYVDFDLGLIRVNQSFVYNERVNRVCLPKDGARDLEGNQDLHVTGWGKTDKGTFSSEVLQKVTVPYVSREICNAEVSYDGVIKETMLCAGYQEGGRDTCQGDSGGPLVYQQHDGRFVQGGIVSWGRQCAQENFYGVYTNLPHFYSWIMSYIGEN